MIAMYMRDQHGFHIAPMRDLTEASPQLRSERDPTIHHKSAALFGEEEEAV
jgi:hypothetical protein